ncbi:hypothetical protein R1sor_002554 [Riccia sorocarpa]|uniref:CCHC-type domain-containing protein n=1 Tax=Riccia sorocarpa TaxID=122646 RepID=A0ABD3H295_9MARC
MAMEGGVRGLFETFAPYQSPQRSQETQGQNAWSRRITGLFNNDEIQGTTHSTARTPSRSTTDAWAADSQAQTKIQDQNVSLQPDPDPILPSDPFNAGIFSPNPDQQTFDGDEDEDQMAMGSGEDSEAEDNTYIALSDFDASKAQNEEYMADRQWQRRVLREVTRAFAKLPDQKSLEEEKEVEIVHCFDRQAQFRILNKKRLLEDTGVVFCTVDISPSRDAFIRWLYEEVEGKSAIQIKHVKVLAPRHFLVILFSTQDRNGVLAGGPYYLRRRMVYTTPWEPGFDTNKVLTKKMACWLDLKNVDPLIEDEATSMLSTLGEVVRVAGVTEKQEGKFPNIRGCVLMDMTKPLPIVMKIALNNAVKRIQIQYDVLPDACYTCHTRGHFARLCPLTTKVTVATPNDLQQGDPPDESFHPVSSKSRRGEPTAAEEKDQSSSSNQFEVLADLVEGEQEQQQQDGGNGETSGTNAEEEVQENLPQEAAERDNLDLNVVVENSTGNQFPDLNSVPEQSVREQIIKQNALEKQMRKDRKKAKKKEARRRRAEKDSPGEPQKHTEEGPGSDPDSDQQESSDDDPLQDSRLWQTGSKKKPKGQGDTMDADTRWSGGQQQNRPTE